MTKTAINAPEGLPFSKAIIHNDEYTMEISGQVGLNSKTGKLEEGVENQTRTALANVEEILETSGWSLKNLIKVRIFLADMKDYDVVNKIYSEYFEEDFPTRVALSVKDLPLGALVEFDCTASGDKI